jgi:Phosphotransferase enzyme family
MGHELTFAGSLVTKRYTSWSRGEHLREWTALRLIHSHEPDLVPRPVRVELAGVPPTVTMSVLPGSPLGDPRGGRLSTAQVDALRVALAALWAVPCHALPAGPGDLDFARRLTNTPRPPGGILGAAHDAALAWWDGPDPALLRQPPPATVLGHRDPNLDNYLWDGSRVRIVDFEDAAVSDPATELAILVEHLSTRAEDLTWLATDFGVDPRRFRAARRVWAMFWLALLLPGGPAADRNPHGTADHQARRLLDLLTGAR